MAWGKAGSTTLSSAGDNIDVTGFTDNKVIIYLNHNIPTGSMTDQLRFDGNSGSNYAFRYNNNGTSESTLVNQSNASYLGWTTNTNQSFSIGYIANISTEEKIGMNHSTDNHDGTGAGTAPNRRETVFKLADTTNSIDEVNVFNSHTGSFDTGSNLTVLGSDITPAAAIPAISNIQDNSLFVEKENARRYWFSEATVPTYETDFSSSTGWSQTGTQHSVNTSTGVIDWNGAASTSVHALSYDLGAVVEDNWTLRFKWVIENHTLGSNPGGWVSIGLSDSDDTVGGSANQDSVSLGSYVGGGTNYIRFHHGNDGSMRQNFTNFSTTNEEATWYVQIVKTGTSVTIGLYPDSTYGTATESKTETISGTGFQYIVVKSRSDNTNGGSVYNGTIDDMKFYNGITSTTPATWTMQPTYETDFSSSTGWTTVGSNITITGGVIQASSMVTQSDNRIYYDLGSALSDKFIIDFDHYADTASAGGFWQMFALTDTTAIPRTDDSIHVLIDMGSWSSYLRYSNEGSETNLALAGSLTTGQWQYVRFVRNGTTGTFYVYSDSDRTNQVLSATGTIPTTVTGLRYFQSGALLGANSGTTTYKIDNLKIYDGVTSATPATWTMQPTLEDDFSTDNFAQTGTEIDVSGGELVWDAQPDGTTTGGYIDFGENLSDTAWVCRFKVQVNNYSGAVTTATNFYIQFQNTTTVDSTTSRDSMGIHLRLKSGNTDWRVEAVDGSVAGGGAGNLIDGSATTETIYVQMYRDGNTIYAEWYDNADYTGTPTNTANHSSGTPANLRYFAVYRRSDTTTTAVSNGIIDDLKIYNGVTSIN